MAYLYIEAQMLLAMDLAPCYDFYDTVYRLWRHCYLTDKLIFVDWWLRLRKEFWKVFIWVNNYK